MPTKASPPDTSSAPVSASPTSSASSTSSGATGSAATARGADAGSLVAAPDFPVIIVTGLSGAGKSTVLNVLEDLRYFTVDGLPASLAPQMVTILNREALSHYQGLVLGMDLLTASGCAKAANLASNVASAVVWIAGGTDKGNDYEPLKAFARAKVHTLVCMGLDNAKLVREFTGVVPEVVSTDSLEAAMTASKAAARPGDAVLLSPACASFDLFRNYENRGELFKNWVEEKA